jgi:Replication initiator protein A
MVATVTANESLADILARIQERYIRPSDIPSIDGTADAPAQHGMPSPSYVGGLTIAFWSAETTAIPAEVFLENMGFFTPSSKRIRGVYRKEKVLGERIGPDGTKRLLKVDIVANHTLGLPITSDLDYYRAFLKILAETIDHHGRLRLPLAVPAKRLIRYTDKTESAITRREVRDWFDRMALTEIRGAVYRAKVRDYQEGFTGTVFSQVVMKGHPLKNGQLAETNYVWPAPWFLANYLRGYVRPIDLAFHNRLRKPIAKALYPLLKTGWYASGGQPYEKRYDALCRDFLLRQERYLSTIRQKLDPAHEELTRAGFLRHWAYRQAAHTQEWVLVYWPGKTSMHGHTALEAHHSHTEPPGERQEHTEGVIPMSCETLLHEILAVCGDTHNEAAYRKALGEYPEHVLIRVLAETRQAAHERRIEKTKGAFFFDTLQRLSDHRRTQNRRRPSHF